MAVGGDDKDRWPMRISDKLWGITKRTIQGSQCIHGLQLRKCLKSPEEHLSHVVLELQPNLSYVEHIKIFTDK